MPRFVPLTSRKLGRRALLVALAFAPLLSGLFVPRPGNAAVGNRPNFVFILTDDQPLGTLGGMKNVLRIQERAAVFNNAFISNPLCCPSRSTILTGLYSHHTGVYTNADARDFDQGGYPAFESHGNLNRTFPLALQESGYRTALFGKYLNWYDGSAQVGWTRFHSFVGKNARYFDYDWIMDSQIVHRGTSPADYSTDVAGREAIRYFLDLQDGSRPFFLFYAPYAPHGPTTPSTTYSGVSAPNTFETQAYNELDVSDKPKYVRETPLLNNVRKSAMAARWNDQYRTLQSVDYWVGKFRDVLASRGLLSNTYFIFMSDNGLEWGDHRLTFKAVPYDRSTHVPMFIAGPGISRHGVSTVVSNVDVSSTILDLAGLEPMKSDGLSLVPLLYQTGFPGREGVLFEHKDWVTLSGWIPSYCGYRTERWAFVRYREQGEELYDLLADPDQLRNIARARPLLAREMRSRMYAAGCSKEMVPPPA